MSKYACVGRLCDIIVWSGAGGLCSDVLPRLGVVLQGMAIATEKTLSLTDRTAKCSYAGCPAVLPLTPRA
jgi:hypothetical protein